MRVRTVKLAGLSDNLEQGKRNHASIRTSLFQVEVRFTNVSSKVAAPTMRYICTILGSFSFVEYCEVSVWLGNNSLGQLGLQS